MLLLLLPLVSFIFNLELIILYFCCFQSKSANVLAVLGAVASEALDLTGFYYSGKPTIVKRRANKISRTSTGRYAFLSKLIDPYPLKQFHCS
jgi:hypothetical protein